MSEVDAVEVRRVDVSALSMLQDLHARSFDHARTRSADRRPYRVLNRWDRRDILILMAFDRRGPEESTPVGFKIGYGRSEELFYSAKGGVLPEFRRRGIGRTLLRDMVGRAQKAGYLRFAFHTLPDRHPGMAKLGRAEGFRLVERGYHPALEDYILRFEKRLQ